MSVATQHVLIRLPQVKAITGLSRSSIYARSKDGRIPRPINLGGRAVAWIESEIVAFVEERIKVSRNLTVEGAQGCMAEGIR